MNGVGLTARRCALVAMILLASGRIKIHQPAWRNTGVMHSAPVGEVLAGCSRPRLTSTKTIRSLQNPKCCLLNWRLIVLTYFGAVNIISIQHKGSAKYQG
jgi:hypothetical protein